MAVQKVVMSKEIEREDGLKGETAEISGAIHSDGILEVKGDFIRVKCKVGDNSRSSSSPKKYKEDGFVAFTADYHGPQGHTPKHN